MKLSHTPEPTACEYFMQLLYVVQTPYNSSFCILFIILLTSFSFWVNLNLCAERCVFGWLYVNVYDVVLHVNMINWFITKLAKQNSSVLSHAEIVLANWDRALDTSAP